MSENNVEEVETVKYPLEKRADAGSHQMDEKDIVDESEIIVISTPNSKRSTVLSKVVKEMASLHCNYDMDSEVSWRSTSLSLERI